MITHDPAVLRAGDIWEIQGTLLDVDGSVLDITGYTIEWRLSAAFDQAVLDEDDVTIAVTDAATGKILITVAAAVTHELLPGHYFDALRIRSLTEGPTTMWSGSILVEPNLFTTVPVLTLVEGSDVALMMGTVT